MTMRPEDILRLKAPGVMQRPEKPREEATWSRLAEYENICRGCGSRRGRQPDGTIAGLFRRNRPAIPLALAESLVFEAQHRQTPSDLRLRPSYFDIALQYVTILTL